jgi:hypothetical protein
MLYSGCHAILNDSGHCNSAVFQEPPSLFAETKQYRPYRFLSPSQRLVNRIRRRVEPRQRKVP